MQGVWLMNVLTEPRIQPQLQVTTCYTVVIYAHTTTWFTFLVICIPHSNEQCNRICWPLQCKPWQLAFSHPCNDAIEGLRSLHTIVKLCMLVVQVSSERLQEASSPYFFWTESRFTKLIVTASGVCAIFNVCADSGMNCRPERAAADSRSPWYADV